MKVLHFFTFLVKFFVNKVATASLHVYYRSTTPRRCGCCLSFPLPGCCWAAGVVGGLWRCSAWGRVSCPAAPPGVSSAAALPSCEASTCSSPASTTSLLVPRPSVCAGRTGCSSARRLACACACACGVRTGLQAGCIGLQAALAAAGMIACGIDAPRLEALEHLVRVRVRVRVGVRVRVRVRVKGSGSG